MRKPRILHDTLSDRILAYIQANPGAESTEIILHLGAHKPSVHTIISRHAKAGLIKQVSICSGVKRWSMAGQKRLSRRKVPLVLNIKQQTPWSALGL